MINQEYINSFKLSSSFNSISKGLLKGDVEMVLLGKNEYRTTSQLEVEDTVPSQVIIAIHILIMEGKLSSGIIQTALDKIDITEENVCHVLSYLEVYKIYRKDHQDLQLDLPKLLDRFKQMEDSYKHLPCFNNLMKSIEIG